MTKGHIKKGKTDSKTPFDLLRDYAEGDENAGKLFRFTLMLSKVHAN
jgi:hypothetical protein